MSRTKLKAKLLQDYPKPYRDALAIFEAFRRLGFDADEIFFGFGNVDGVPNSLHMQLQTQGKTFTVSAGVLKEPRAKVLKTWQKVAALANQLPPQSEQWNEHVWKQHLLGSSRDYFALFAVGVRDKGIILPVAVATETIGSA